VDSSAIFIVRRKLRVTVVVVVVRWEGRETRSVFHVSTALLAGDRRGSQETVGLIAAQN
jgi:hypothetical protein